MRYSIIFLVVVGLISNCLLAMFINGEHLFPGPHARPWEINGCGSPFQCFALALIVVILLRNLLGQINIRPTTTSRITPTAGPACPARYLLYTQSCGSFCYRYESSECRTWDDARVICQGERGDLLAPSQCIYGFLRVQARKNEGSCSTNFWLGARRTPNGGDFRTVGGDPIASNASFWGSRQPDNAKGLENCFEMRKDFSSYLANDRECSLSQGYICQIMI